MDGKRGRGREGERGRGRWREGEREGEGGKVRGGEGEMGRGREGERERGRGGGREREREGDRWCMANTQTKIKFKKGMFLYAVSSQLNSSKLFIFNSLTDLFIPAPTRLLLELF